MAKREKFKVYLAGPITGCNDAQLHQWREEVKAKYAKDFSFIDPTTRWVNNPLGKGATPLEIVEADLQGIENADGMLVNMWRESIGASIGVVHAHRLGRPVVVADPNHLDSRMLTFYADGLEDHPLKAANVLRSLLRAERWRVQKAGGRASEPFDRRKLVAFIGDKCRRARRDDVVVPRIVLPGVIDHLKRRKIGDQITTSAINRAVQGTLEDLSKDDGHRNSVEGVLDQWYVGDSVKRERKTRLADASDKPNGEYRGASVRVYAPKSHSTIYGKKVSKLSDIPSAEARRFFEIIMRTPGITEIPLGSFGHKERRSSVCGVISWSPTPYVLEGKLFDRGDKGTVQTFQVRVQDEATKKNVLAQCEKNLRSANLWAE